MLLADSFTILLVTPQSPSVLSERLQSNLSLRLVSGILDYWNHNGKKNKLKLNIYSISSKYTKQLLNKHTILKNKLATAAWSDFVM